MNKKITFKPILVRFLFLSLILLCLSPLISASGALFFGIVFSLIFGNPYLDYTRRLTQRLLQLSVIGLGAGMNLSIIGHEFFDSLGYTAAGILLTVLLGLVMGKLLKTEATISLLLTVGTAICGGSAIAAVAPIIRAKPHEISIALATVFFLNAAALFIFPPIGHFFNLSQTQFGYWAALAIHDTSSVIGAAMQYGSKAVEIATTVKLTRALWIIPAALLISYIWHYNSSNHVMDKPKVPFFISGFIVAAALVTFVPDLRTTGMFMSAVAKKTLVLTLFFIGSTFVRSTIESVGIRPFIQGIVLWIVMASVTLIAILIML